MSAVELHLAADHPAFAGHFPGQPLLPGVVLLAEVLEAALADAELCAMVGPTPRLGVAKFLAPILPGVAVSVEFTPSAGALRFACMAGGRLAASGHFDRVDAGATATA